MFKPDRTSGKVIHMQRFMQGRKSPNEVHRELAWNGAKCKCGSPAAIRCITFAEKKELERRAQPMLVKLAMENEGRIPVVEFKYGKFVRVGEAFACSGHKKDLMHAAARGMKKATWLLHEFDEGPNPREAVSIQSSGMPEAG